MRYKNVTPTQLSTLHYNLEYRTKCSRSVSVCLQGGGLQETDISTSTVVTAQLQQ